MENVSLTPRFPERLYYMSENDINCIVTGVTGYLNVSPAKNFADVYPY